MSKAGRLDRDFGTVLNGVMKQITKKIRLVTKDDLKKAIRDLATKKDLERFATKDDLRRFATKDDLRRFATKDDLTNAFSHLPSKEEFYKKMDEVMGELLTAREENIILSGMKHQVNDHEDRIELIEEKLAIQPLMA